MGHNSADQAFPRSPRSHSRSSEEARGRVPRARMPSSAGYMMAAVITAVALFFVLWWMLVSGGDEAPWLPAGLAASVVLLVALSAREVVMRRAWTRYLLEHGIQEHSSSSGEKSQIRKKSYSSSLHSAALRAIQKQSGAADSIGSSPEAHLEVVQLCHDYLTSTEDAMRSGSFTGEKGIAIKAGHDRVRALHKHHLLIWARDHSRALTRDAQQRARISHKIETANRALECIDSALRLYPDEIELNESKVAIGEFIASVRVAHWVELAERSAFKGHYRRAINRYKDALFYLRDMNVKEEVRTAGSERIEREIEELRTRLRADNGNKGRRADEHLSGGGADES